MDVQANKELGMAVSKLTLELGAVAALAAVMLGGFYYQGTRIDVAMQRLDVRIDVAVQRLDARIDGLEVRIDGLDARIDGLDARIDGLDVRLARIEGLLEGWLSGPPPRPD